MLSRVAGRIFWVARYQERAENTARLLNTYHFLLLDLPRGTRVGWHILPYITGSYTLYQEIYLRHDERNTMKFMLADNANTGSLVNSIRMLRENARTSREELPGEAWEQINELYHYAQDNYTNALSRRGRFEFLTDIIQRCEQLTGMFSGTMSHDVGYNFIRIGRNLERADMTTRVIDIGAASLKDSNEDISSDSNIWSSMLRALGAYQMYRKDVQLGVHCAEVVEYLLQHTTFPRSVAHCLDRLEECVTPLPKHKNVLLKIRDARKHVGRIKSSRLDAETLHNEMDRFQVEIADINRQISADWFL